jgi:hypothetical protein
MIIVWCFYRGRSEVAFRNLVPSCASEEHYESGRITLRASTRGGKSEIFPFAYWRACILASNVVNKKYIVKQIIDDIKERCAGGREYLSKPENKKKIHAMVFSSKIKMGTLRYGLLGEKKKSKYTMVGSLIIGPKSKRTRHSILVTCMKNFPDSVTAEDGYQRLRQALAGTDHKLSTETKAERRTAQKAINAGAKIDL